MKVFETALKNGLGNAVKDILNSIDSSVLKVNLYMEGLNGAVDSNVDSLLYGIIRECVSNVIQHSGAGELDISLIKDNDGIAVAIEDNGKGFTVKEKTGGTGLENILARVNDLNGIVDIDSAPGKGTLVAIYLPV